MIVRIKMALSPKNVPEARFRLRGLRYHKSCRVHGTNCRGFVNSISRDIARISELRLTAFTAGEQSYG